MELTKEEVIEKLKLERSILADGGYGRQCEPPGAQQNIFGTPLAASTWVSPRKLTLAPIVS